MSRPRVLISALAVFVVWTSATWWLEGRIHTFLRPEAAFDRALYALVANLLAGVAASLWVLQRWRDAEGLDAAGSGFGPVWRMAVAVVVGGATGLAFYVLQGAPYRHPVVVLNAFAQVFVVSAAEVLVCWSLVARAVEDALGCSGLAKISAAFVASVMFGLYHYAHSPPFNTVGMVLLLSAVGLGTSLFFFVTQDVAGTIVFHNFLALLGVVQALDQAGVLVTFERPQPALLGMAAVTAAGVGAGYGLLRPHAELVRRRGREKS
jgi:hypothetical protein